eukprot:6207082-Pleurochrysis_carterae.AAC.1
MSCVSSLLRCWARQSTAICLRSDVEPLCKLARTAGLLKRPLPVHACANMQVARTCSYNFRAKSFATSVRAKGFDERRDGKAWRNRTCTFGSLAI